MWVGFYICLHILFEWQFQWIARKKSMTVIFLCSAFATNMNALNFKCFSRWILLKILVEYIRREEKESGESRNDDCIRQWKRIVYTQLNNEANGTRLANNKSCYRNNLWIYGKQLVEFNFTNSMFNYIATHIGYKYIRKIFMI